MPQPVFSQYGPDGRTIQDPNLGPYKLSYTLAQTNVPAGNAPSGTMAANGAVTLGTALPYIMPSLFLYFPAGAVFAGSAAGFYYCQMSSTTVGVVYNNLMGVIPVTPANPTPIVAAGPGAYTGVTTALTVFSCQVPANTLLPNGQLRVNYGAVYTNSAGNKTLARTLGGNTLATSTRTTNARDSSTERVYALSASRLLYQPASDSTTASTSGASLFTLDLTQDQTYNWISTAVTATDFMLLTSLCIEVLPS
jgi:hypothetical protein